MLDEEGEDALPLLVFFNEPWKAELAGTLPPFGGGAGTGAPVVLRLELPFSFDLERERF